MNQSETPVTIGPSLPADVARKKDRQLQEIRTTVKMIVRSLAGVSPLMGPRAGHALVAAAIAGLVTLLSFLAVQAEQPDLMTKLIVASAMPPAVERYMSPATLGLFVGALTWCYVLFSSKLPQTYQELLCHQVLQYEPVDRIAYQSLQAIAQERCVLDYMDVCAWMADEREALDSACGRKLSPSLAAFVNKKV